MIPTAAYGILWVMGFFVLWEGVKALHAEICSEAPGFSSFAANMRMFLVLIPSCVVTQKWRCFFRFVIRLLWIGCGGLKFNFNTSQNISRSSKHPREGGSYQLPNHHLVVVFVLLNCVSDVVQSQNLPSRDLLLRFNLYSISSIGDETRFSVVYLSKPTRRFYGWILSLHIVGLCSFR